MKAAWRERPVPVLGIEIIHGLLGISLTVLCGSAVSADLNSVIKNAKEAVNRIGGGLKKMETGTAPQDKTNQADAKPEPTDKTSSPSATGNSNQPYDTQMVRDIQRMLNEIGYSAGAPDGNYRLESQGALREFQRDRGLAVTGQPSYAVAKALDTAAREGYRKPINAAASAGQQGRHAVPAGAAVAVSSAAWQPCNRLPKRDDEEICHPQSLWQIMRMLDTIGYRNKFKRHSYIDHGLNQQHREAIMKFQGDHGFTIDGRATKRLGEEVRKAYEQRKAAAAKVHDARQSAKNDLDAPSSEEDRDRKCRNIGMQSQLTGPPTQNKKAFFEAHCRNTRWSSMVK